MASSKKKTTLKVPHGASESDISKLDPENPLIRRQKRPRNDNLENSEEDLGGPSLKEELLDMLTSWKKDQDIVLGKLCSEISELKKQNSEIQATNSQLEQSLTFISSQYEDMKKKLLAMEHDRKEHRSYIGSLEAKIDELQKRSKFTVFEVRNLPVPHERETQQDLCNLVQKTCGALGVDIQPWEIKDVHRLKNKTGSTVVTDLTTVVARNKILNAVKDYNKKNSTNKLSSATLGIPGPNTPIYLTESLSNKDRKLFAMAREARKLLGFKYCWTNLGRIYLRKTEGSPRIEIKNDTDLAALKKD